MSVIDPLRAYITPSSTTVWSLSIVTIRPASAIGALLPGSMGDAAINAPRRLPYRPPAGPRTADATRPRTYVQWPMRQFGCPFEWRQGRIRVDLRPSETLL